MRQKLLVRVLHQPVIPKCVALGLWVQRSSRSEHHGGVKVTHNSLHRTGRVDAGLSTTGTLLEGC